MKSTKSQIAQSTNKAQNRDTQRTNFMKKSQSNQKGAGLIEVLAAVAVFTIGIMTVLHLYSGSYSAATHSTEKNQAILLAREGLEAVRSVRDENFESVTGGGSTIQRTDFRSFHWTSNHEMEDLQTDGDNLVLAEELAGDRVSNALSLDEIKDVESSLIEWSSDEPTDTSIGISTAINEDPNTAPTNWTEATSGSSIPGINVGDDLTGKYLWAKQDLSTADSSFTPKLHSLTATIEEIGEDVYVEDGYRIANAISLDEIRDVESSLIEWNSAEPTNTTITVSTALNEDSNTAPAEWQEATNESSIPGITESDNLFGKYLWVKQELTTADIDITPEFHSSKVFIEEAGEEVETWHGVGLEDNKWEIKTYSEMDIKDTFTREISIEETDENTRKITSTVSWEPLRGEPTSVILTEYLTNWRETYEIEYTLVVNSGQGGFVDFPGEDEFTFYYGDVVDIVAVADEGYEFDEWTGDTDNIDNIANSSTTITINDDYDITATFVEEEGGEE